MTDNLIKCILLPVHPVSSFVETYVLLIGDPNPSNFKRTIELKGITKAEKAELIQEFARFLPETPSGDLLSKDLAQIPRHQTPLEEKFKIFKLEEGVKRLLGGNARLNDNRKLNEVLKNKVQK